MASTFTGVHPRAPAQPASEPPPPTLGQGSQRKLLAGALALLLMIGLYAVLGFHVAPRVLRAKAIEHMRETYGCELSLGAIHINPFALSLEIHDSTLPDAEGEPMLGLEHLYVNFEALSSLFRWHYSFGDVRLEDPLLRAVIRPDGTLNFADLMGDAPSEAPSLEGWPRVRIGHFAMTGGDVGFVDARRARPVEERITRLDLTLDDVDTTGEDGQLELSARLPGGGTMHWRGSLGLEPDAHAAGTTTLSDLSLKEAAYLLDDVLPFQVSSGTLSFGVSYALQVKDAGPPVKGSGLQALSGEVELAHIELRNLGLRRRGVGSDELSLEAVHVKGMRVDLTRQAVSIEEVVATQPKAIGVLEPNGGFTLFGLAGRASSDDGPSPSDSGAGREAPAAMAWSAELGLLAVRGATLEVFDEALAPGTRLRLTPIDVSLRGASLDLRREVEVALDVGIEGDPVIHVAGRVRPKPLAGSVDVAISAANLTLMQPYLDRLVSWEVRRGTLDLEGRLTLGEANPEGERSVFEGELHARDFLAVDAAQKAPLVSLQRVAVTGVRHTTGPRAMHIAEISLVRPVVRALINAKGELNLSNAFVAKSTIDPRQSAKEAPLPLLVDTGGHARFGPDSDQLLEERVAEALHQTPMRIDVVRVRAMELDFTDRNVRPHFAARMSHLHGSVRNLSKDPRTRARLSMSGRVSRNAPVKIRGTLQPFAPASYSTLDMELSNLSLPIFNPYSTHFAGFEIAQGELSTVLHYEIRNQQLDASHHVRIDQLTWGARKKGHGEGRLPVRLATALLRDRQGVIELDLPVSGSVDEPDFELGPVIRQALKNTVIKACAAPFDLLGRAFHGADEARYVSFAPGEDRIDATTQQALAVLGEAMRERESLQVIVPVGFEQALDEPALRRLALERTVTAKGQGAADYASGPAALKALGQRRAAAIESILVKGGVDPTRVLVSTEGDVSAQGERVRLELKIE